MQCQPIELNLISHKVEYLVKIRTRLIDKKYQQKLFQSASNFDNTSPKRGGKKTAVQLKTSVIAL